MVKVVLAWEVCQQQCLWVGSKCFAQVFVILSWEGTMLCTGKAQSGGVQVFCAVQLSWRTWWKPEMMPRALLSHALWKKGAWPQGLGPESARTFQRCLWLTRGGIYILEDQRIFLLFKQSCSWQGHVPLSKTDWGRWCWHWESRLPRTEASQNEWCPQLLLNTLLHMNSREAHPRNWCRACNAIAIWLG